MKFSYLFSRCEPLPLNRKLSFWVCSHVYVRIHKRSSRFTSTMIVIVKQRTTFTSSMFLRPCTDLVTNVFFSFINIVSKFASMPISALHQKGTEPPSPALSPTPKNPAPTIATSLGNSVLTVPGTLDTSTMGLTEGQLRRQGLECLVSVLRSLVAWGIAVGKGDDVHTGAPSRSQYGDDAKRETSTPEGPADRLSVASSETFRHPTPELVDDPSRFESAKQKKTTLLEGIKKFNFKPKKVRTCQVQLVFHIHMVHRGSNSSLSTVSSEVGRLWISPNSC